VQPIRLISGFVTVGFWTFLSRIFGFVRDILIAAFLGSGPVAEAFLIAFSLPEHVPPLLRRRRLQHGLRADVRQAGGGGRGPARLRQDAWSA
jgi:putative peptidoglycan lipid II flippase